LALRPAGCRWNTAGESAKLPVNSQAFQHCTHDWKRMNTEFVNILTELKIGLGKSDMKTGKLKSELPWNT